MTLDEVSIVVGDRLKLVADGMKVLIAAAPHLKIIDHAVSGNELLTKVKAHKPDLVIMDVSMPGKDGIDTTRELKKKLPDVLVLAHSALNDIEYINSMLIEGASGYVLKGATAEEMIKAINIVMDGGKYLSPAAMEEVNKGYAHTFKDIKGEYIGLTQREKEIIRMIAMEKTNKEIADELFVSLETVKSHRKNLMVKLNVKSVAGLVRYAVDRCWV